MLCKLARGIFYTQQEEWRLALKDLNRAIKLDSKNPEAYLSRGNVYALQQRWEQAEQDYKQAARLNPNYPELQASINSLEQQQASNNSDNSRDWQDINQSHEYNTSGLTHALKQEFTEALSDFDQAIALNPDNA